MILAHTNGHGPNRYTLGTGLYLDPFEIDIALAQSRDPIIDHQLTIGFRGFERKTTCISWGNFAVHKKMIPSSHG